MAQQHIPSVIHMAQLGSKTVIDMQKIKEEELERLVDAINKESILRREKIKEQLYKLKTEQMNS